MQADPATLHIAVSIVSYGTADMVADALPPLLEELSRFASGRVVIVDNASPEQETRGAIRLAERLEEMGRPPQVTLVAHPENGGFAAGNNVAFDTLRAQAAEGAPVPDAVLLLNPDAVMAPGCIVELARVMAETPTAGVVGAQLIEGDGTRWQAAFNFPSAIGEFARDVGLGVFYRRWPVQPAPLSAPGPVDWVTGAAMLIRWEMLEAVGDMDAVYFLYYEEVDFMLHVWRSGWEVWHAPGAAVTHLPGGATGIVDGRPKRGRMPGYWLESYNRYFAKNHGAAYMRLAALMKVLGLGLCDLQRRLRGLEPICPPHLKGDLLRVCVFGKARG